MARVLVIDDEDVIGAVLRYALLEQGHETLLAEGGRQGIERALTDHPDAIVLDLMMPEVTGHDVLAALRDDAADEDVPDPRAHGGHAEPRTRAVPRRGRGQGDDEAVRPT